MRVQTQLFGEVQLLAFRRAQTGEDGEGRRQLERMWIEMHGAERGGVGYQFFVDTRLVRVVERIRHLDDHHAIQQRLVLLFLQKLVKLRQIGVRDDGLVQINQREARDFYVLLLCQGQQQIQEFALDLQ